MSIMIQKVEGRDYKLKTQFWSKRHYRHNDSISACAYKFCCPVNPPATLAKLNPELAYNIRDRVAFRSGQGNYRNLHVFSSTGWSRVGRLQNPTHVTTALADYVVAKRCKISL